MSKKILISEKHGVNPTIPICFWCGKEKNEVALLGKLPGDEEAPMNIIIDYEPCDECREKMKQGITFIEASSSPKIEKQQSIVEGIYPSSHFVVLKEEICKDMIKDEEMLKQILEKRIAFVDEDVWNQLFEHLI